MSTVNTYIYLYTYLRIFHTVSYPILLLYDTWTRALKYIRILKLYSMTRIARNLFVHAKVDNAHHENVKYIAERESKILIYMIIYNREFKLTRKQL